MHFNTIDRYFDSAGYFDSYGPPEVIDEAVINCVADGDRIEVKWPDGTIEPFVVQLIHAHVPLGHAKIPIQGAYILIDHFGHSLTLRLADSNLMVRKIG